MADANGRREALAAHLREHGILYASAAQPIRHRDGALAPWAFYSWGSTLTSEGLRLAALCILDRLRDFRATQLATIGYTGMPLLSACVLLGEGRYRGLCIRETRKPYLSCRRVEGELDRSAPVAIIDDSISSGTSLGKAIRAIEDEGAEVEGAVALVKFPHRGGLEWANSAGYRAEAILDIWSDLGMARTFPKPRRRLAPPFGAVVAADGLDPASLSRFAATTYLATGLAPRPPRRMDREHECSGGVFVSFRERANEDRIAREGFWHFDPAEASAADDIIAATIDTIRAANNRITAQNLASLKIAVTFLSRLEPIAPSGLDFTRYGIVVESRAFPYKRGGALPNTQVFISEVEQYRQAREANAGVGSDEPHQLYRHEVIKHVEPGETWLPYGTPEDAETAWWRDITLGKRLATQARALLASELAGRSSEASSLPADILTQPIVGVAVRLYQAGLVGYGLALGDALDDALRRAVAQVANDPRLADEADPSRCAVVVSVLHHPEPLGAAPLAQVARKLRRGLDALGARHAGRTHVLLPSVLTYNNFSREDFVAATARMAGGATQDIEWRTFQCAEWLEHDGAVRALRFGFPDRSERGDRAVDAAALIRLLGAYIAGSIGADGLPRYMLLPVAATGQARGTAARAIHALMALGLAGAYLDHKAWRDIAASGLRNCLDHVRDGAIVLPGWVGGPLADAVLLRAVAGHPALAATAAALALAERLKRLLRPDGRIGAMSRRADRPEDHDFLPGATLAALGEFAAAGQSALPHGLSAQIGWYARRFTAVPTWGSAGWLPQGMATVHRMTADPAAARLAFAVTDWSLERQLQSTGAFLEDLSPDEPSFNTGFLAEGVAASWAIALAIGDAERADRYARSWSQAIGFMERLIVFPEDVFAMRAGEAAVGGVRCTLSRSDIRIDQVSHCLHALVTGARPQRALAG